VFIYLRITDTLKCKMLVTRGCRCQCVVVGKGRGGRVSYEEVFMCSQDDIESSPVMCV